MYFNPEIFQRELTERVGPLPDNILDYIENKSPSTTAYSSEFKEVIETPTQTDTITVTVTEKRKDVDRSALIIDPLQKLKGLAFDEVIRFIQNSSRQPPSDHDSPNIYPIYPRPKSNYILYQNIYEIHPDLYRKEIPILVWVMSQFPSNLTHGREIRIDSEEAIQLRRKQIGELVWNDIIQESKPFHTDNLAKYFLKDFGSFFLSPTEDPNELVVDFDFLKVYEVHNGFYKYGGVMYLRDGEINRIVYDSVTYDHKHPEYPRIEYIFRASLCMRIVVELHAAFCHLTVANPTAIDLVQHQDTYAYSEKLRKFLRITTTRTLEINAAIGILAINDGSILSRMFALTPASHKQYIVDSFANLPKVDEPFKLEAFLKGKLQGTPWSQKAQKYYNSMQNYIKSEIFDNHPDTDESKIKKYTNHFFVSTIFHEILGDRALYDIVVSGYLPTRVKIANWKVDDDIICDIVSTAALAVATRIPKHSSPKIRDILPNFWKPTEDIKDDAAFLEVAVGY